MCAATKGVKRWEIRSTEVIYSPQRQQAPLSYSSHIILLPHVCVSHKDFLSLSYYFYYYLVPCLSWFGFLFPSLCEDDEGRDEREKKARWAAGETCSSSRPMLPKSSILGEAASHCQIRREILQARKKESGRERGKEIERKREKTENGKSFQSRI